eukprot:2355056-Rhodomonas_salina.1
MDQYQKAGSFCAPAQAEVALASQSLSDSRKVPVQVRTGHNCPASMLRVNSSPHPIDVVPYQL